MESMERLIIFLYIGFPSKDTSTIANLIRRNTVPSIPTVEAICNGFGISLSQFFSDGDTIEVSSDYKPLIDCWSALSPEQREAALKLLQVINQA